MPGQRPLITDMSLHLPAGARCLLIGANGAGKTTLLKILAGKHMVDRQQVAVLGQPPFHATELTTSGQLAYVGGNWTRDIAFAGTSIPLTVRDWGWLQGLLVRHQSSSSGGGTQHGTRQPDELTRLLPPAPPCSHAHPTG
jgi:ABC-type Mn2+/Zn2+ transport system ATPase subunit